MTGMSNPAQKVVKFEEAFGGRARAIPGVAGLVPLLAPWELLVRTGAATFETTTLLPWLVSAGALAVSLPLLGAARFSSDGYGRPEIWPSLRAGVGPVPADTDAFASAVAGGGDRGRTQDLERRASGLVGRRPVRRRYALLASHATGGSGRCPGGGAGRRIALAPAPVTLSGSRSGVQLISPPFSGRCAPGSTTTSRVPSTARSTMTDSAPAALRLHRVQVIHRAWIVAATTFRALTKAAASGAGLTLSGGRSPVFPATDLIVRPGRQAPP